jgi:hypothetical protein
LVSLWGAATASSCQSGISTRLLYLQKRASRAIVINIVNRTSPAVVEKGEGRIPDLAEQLHASLFQTGCQCLERQGVMAAKKRRSGTGATPASDATKPRTKPATTPAAPPQPDDDFAFEVPMSQVPMSQARKSFGAEMAKLQMAGAQGGKDDEAKFLRGVSTLGKDLSCCLCLSTFERPVRTSCKHYYCAECLNESLRRKQQCPLCKTKVTRRDVEDDEFVAALVWKYRRIVTAANAS